MLVGVGVAELSREDLFKGGGGVKSGVAVRMTEPAFDCPSLNEAAADGSFMLQVRRPQTSDFIIRTGCSNMILSLSVISARKWG